MFTHKKIIITSIIIIMCAAFAAALFFLRLPTHKKEPVPIWREDFNPSPKARTSSPPTGWRLGKKPGTRTALFSIETDLDEGGSYLHMNANKASSSLVTEVKGVEIAETPFLRWRWRATTLPKDADGRERTRDDQAIGIYVSTGKIYDNKGISYRWDTVTPRGSEGNCVYGMGAIKISWRTLRNEEDAKEGKWYMEERNIVEDFKNAWGFYPKKIYLSVSCNSQYTRSRSVADLDWIELNAASGS